MYEVTSSPLVSRTRATLRSAEFGFLGVVVYTRMQTPRFCGHPCIAGVFDFFRTASRPLRTSWLIVGIDLHRRERRQNPHFITERPYVVNVLRDSSTWGPRYGPQSPQRSGRPGVAGAPLVHPLRIALLLVAGGRYRARGPSTRPLASGGYRALSVSWGDRRRGVEGQHAVERLHGLAARGQDLDPRVVVETCAGRDEPADDDVLLEA